MQQILAHSIKVTQREIAKNLTPCFEIIDQPDEPSIGIVQTYQRRNPNDNKKPIPWGSKYLPLHPEPVLVPLTSQSNDNVLQRVSTTISKTII